MPCRTMSTTRHSVGVRMSGCLGLPRCAKMLTLLRLASRFGNYTPPRRKRASIINRTQWRLSAGRLWPERLTFYQTEVRIIDCNPAVVGHGHRTPVQAADAGPVNAAAIEVVGLTVAGVAEPAF